MLGSGWELVLIFEFRGGGLGFNGLGLLQGFRGLGLRGFGV